MSRGNYKVDMHIHTNASDGTWTNEELLEEIIAKNIKVFSITDHDTIENSLKMINSLPDDIFYVIGVEICCTYNDQEYHITAYDFDYRDAELQQLLDFNIMLKEEFDIKVVKYIKMINRIEDIEDFYSYEDNRARGGWKSLNYLLDKNVIRDFKEYFEIINPSNERILFKEPKEIIEIIKKAGGYSFLAHPSAYKKGEILPINILKDWKDFGIDGIECFSPYLLNMEDANYYIEFCNENNLMISAGSDCHGKFNNRTLGVPSVTMNDVRFDFLPHK